MVKDYSDYDWRKIWSLWNSTLLFFIAKNGINKNSNNKFVALIDNRSQTMKGLWKGIMWALELSLVSSHSTANVERGFSIMNIIGKRLLSFSEVPADRHQYLKF